MVTVTMNSTSSVDVGEDAGLNVDTTENLRLDFYSIPRVDFASTLDMHRAAQLLVQRTGSLGMDVQGEGIDRRAGVLLSLTQLAAAGVVQGPNMFDAISARSLYSSYLTPPNGRPPLSQGGGRRRPIDVRVDAAADVLDNRPLFATVNTPRLFKTAMDLAGYVGAPVLMMDQAGLLVSVATAGGWFAVRLSHRIGSPAADATGKVLAEWIHELGPEQVRKRRERKKDD